MKNFYHQLRREKEFKALRARKLCEINLSKTAANPVGKMKLVTDYVYHQKQNENNWTWLAKNIFKDKFLQHADL